MRVTDLASVAALAALQALSAGPAAAHVAPSATENNRYLKLTVEADRVRLSYTVFFGDRPGAGERLRMDRSGDGLIDDAEKRQFGDELRVALAPQVAVELDGQPILAVWKVADVGLGLPQTSGGAFAVDLVLDMPTGARTGTHSVWIDDRFAVPLPGETEVRVEESPGVRVAAAHLGREGTGVQLRYAFKGAPRTPGERALLVSYTVSAEAAAEAASARPAGSTSGDALPGAGTPPARKPRGRALWLALGALGMGAMVLAVRGLVRTRRPTGT
jgi:hypothetical protein